MPIISRATLDGYAPAYLNAVGNPLHGATPGVGRTGVRAVQVGETDTQGVSGHFMRAGATQDLLALYINHARSAMEA